MKFLLSVSIGIFLTAGASAAIAAATAAPVTLTPDSLHWVAGPAKGSLVSILVGNPNKSGNDIIRAKFPNGYINPPHYHAHPEYITVIRGTLLFGMGDTVNKAEAKVLPAGSFIMVPTGVHHWSIAQGETVEQVGGEGPLKNIPIKHGNM